MTEDLKILQEYRNIFRKHEHAGIIDIDTFLQHKFTFQIHRLETVVKELDGIVPPSRQSQYFVMLIKNSRGLMSVGGLTFSVKNNMLVFIPKRMVYASKYWDTLCSGYLLSFSIDFFVQNAFSKKHISEKKMFKGLQKPFINLSKEQVKKIELIFEYILSEYNAGRTIKNEMLAVKILELLILCERFYTEGQSIDNEQIHSNSIEQFKELLEKHFYDRRSVKFYADALNLHPNHLNFLSKKHTGSTAKENINSRVLLEAKFLLTSSSLSIKEIAYKLGFESVEYFYSFFRKQTQATPSMYRDKFV